MAGQVLQEVSRIALEATELNGPRSGIRGLVGGVVEAIGTVGEEVATMLADGGDGVLIIILHAFAGNSVEQGSMVIGLIAHDAIMS